MVDKENELKTEFQKKIEDIDENYNKLEDKLNLKVYGVGTKVRDLLDIGQDIPPDFLDGIGTSSYRSSKKHLLDIVGKDSDSRMPLEEVMESALSQLGKSMQSSPSYQERVLLEEEYNYMCAQMPQLLNSIEIKVNNILSPDGTTKKFIKNEIVEGDDYISDQELQDLCMNKDVEVLIKDIYTKTFISGTKYGYTVPYRKIAERIYSRYLEKESPGLIQESNIEEKEIDVSLFKESIEEVIYSDHDSKYVEYYGESVSFSNNNDKESDMIVTENPIIDGAKDSIAFQINKEFEKGDSFFGSQDGVLIGEARSKFSKMTGCHVEVLENERCIPVVVNREVIGVYYIEKPENLNMSRTNYHISNMTGSNYINDTNDAYNEHNNMTKNMVTKKLRGIIKRNLDKKLIKKNKKILDTIEHILKNSEGSNYKVRYIPRKYITPFAVNKDNMGLGRSQLHRSRIVAHMWILLNYSNLMNKLFFEKDKMLVNARASVSKDLGSVAKRALEAVKKIYPMPNEILDLSKTHGRMADIARVIMPQSKNGTKAIDIERLEGQALEENYEFKKDLEHIATTLVGVPFSMTDTQANTDYATNLISQDIHQVTSSITYQIELEKQISEFITKIARYEKDNDNITIRSSLPLPKALTEGLQGDTLDKIRNKVDTLVDFIVGEDQEKRDFMRKKLFKKETGSTIDWFQIEKILDKYKAENSEEDDDSGGGRF
ncbi:MAG: hypothetical protein ACOCRK_00830 [bacterium]